MQAATAVLLVQGFAVINGKGQGLLDRQESTGFPMNVKRSVWGIKLFHHHLIKVSTMGCSVTNVYSKLSPQIMLHSTEVSPTVQFPYVYGRHAVLS